MAELATIARPYAKAIFSLAKQGGDYDNWSRVLGELAEVFQNNSIMDHLQNPSLTREAAAAVVIDAMPWATPQIKHFISLITENDRLDAVADIAAQFEILRAKELQQLDVELVVAQAVDSAYEEKMRAALSKRFGKTIRLHTVVDESLVGGAVIRAGDTVIDGSVRGRVDRLAVELTV